MAPCPRRRVRATGAQWHQHDPSVFLARAETIYAGDDDKSLSDSVNCFVAVSVAHGPFRPRLRYRDVSRRNQKMRILKRDDYRCGIHLAGCGKRLSFSERPLEAACSARMLAHSAGRRRATSSLRQRRSGWRTAYAPLLCASATVVSSVRSAPSHRSGPLRLRSLPAYATLLHQRLAGEHQDEHRTGLRASHAIRLRPGRRVGLPPGAILGQDGAHGCGGVRQRARWQQ